MQLTKIVLLAIQFIALDLTSFGHYTVISDVLKRRCRS